MTKIYREPVYMSKVIMFMKQCVINTSKGDLLLV